ncbi:hypothetical protein JMJ35_000736 [Cladonia borealis]|uniref:Uncharacterized protein n=1 Tax=Cladonia borealis TaxID=184061 RepID=A0AA39V4P4_9LECA|nr:hypothetical protein JMJ35_000736 [Cladonia borealis]
MLLSRGCRFLVCVSCLTLPFLTDALSSLHPEISNFTGTRYSSGTKCSQWVDYESDGIPTPGYTACSCTAELSSAESKFGSLSSYSFIGASAWVTTTTLPDPLPTSYTVPEDCCVKCGVTAKEVRLFYWPIETDTKNATSGSTTMTTKSAPFGFISDGFTFTSPSIYVAYTGLRATSECIEFGTPQVGQIHNTTIAYAPEELSTSQESEFYAGTRFYTAINYTLLQHPTIVTSYGPFQGTTPQIYFSLPADLSLADPAWNGCLPDEYGAFDPPRTLGAASALVSPGAGAQASPVATPGPSIAPAYAPATPTPESSSPGPGPPQIAQPALGSAEPNLGTNSNQSPNSQDPNSPDSNIATPTLQPPDPQKSAGSPTNPVIGTAALISPFSQDGSGGNNAQGAPSNPDATNMSSSGGKYPGGPNGNDPNVGPGSDPKSNSDLPPADPVQPLPSAGNKQAQTDAAGGLVIGSNHGDTLADLTIPIGSKTTIAGQMISAFASPGTVYGRIYALPLNGGAGLQTSVPPSDPLLIAGESILRASGGGIIIGSSTIEPGSAVTMSGYTVLAGQSDVLIDGSTYTLPSSVGAVIQQFPNNQAMTLSNGGIISAGGSPITLSGTVYSIIPGDGSNLVASEMAATIPKTAQSVFTIDGQAYTAVPNGFAISGQTIAERGSAVTIGGTVFSLGPSGLQIGSSTIPLNAGQTGGAGLGDLIMSGFGGAPTVTSRASNSSSVMAFTGGSPRSANKSPIDIRIAVLYLVGVGIGIAAYVL